ncbi:MAG: hypothetical protein M9933_17805 [Chitinophagaceae bacterium]|nr:hypothetical protein [Chitinophagaceae bacterium]
MRKHYTGVKKKQPENRKFLSEKKRFFDFLQIQVATATQAAAALGIYRPNACRYKRWLEKESKLFVVKKDVCPVTGFRAGFLTTDPAKMPKNLQTSLF